MGYPIAWRTVFKGTIEEVFEELRNPAVALNKFRLVLQE